MRNDTLFLNANLGAIIDRKVTAFCGFENFQSLAHCISGCEMSTIVQRRLQGPTWRSCARVRRVAHAITFFLWNTFYRSQIEGPHCVEYRFMCLSFSAFRTKCVLDCSCILYFVFQLLRNGRIGCRDFLPVVHLTFCKVFHFDLSYLKPVIVYGFHHVSKCANV